MAAGLMAIGNQIKLNQIKMSGGQLKKQNQLCSHSNTYRRDDLHGAALQ